jgi:hypothetical protein
MDYEKWLRLILLLAIFFGILKCVSIPQRNSNSIITHSNNNEKCNFTKEYIKKEIKEGKEKASDKINKCNSQCLNGNSNSKSCGSENGNGNGSGDGCKSCTDLLPVMDPMYNMREMCKQIILLEDHLFQKEKRCHDCICKHFLTIEALAEEAITLDKSHKYPELEEIPTKVRVITKKYISNHNEHSQHAVTGQDLRELRKGLMQKCFNAF